MSPLVEIRNSVRFYLNGSLVELADVPPDRTVLDFLRLERALMGTKEGCAEGDCGACTVLVGRLDEKDGLTYETINACIRFVASLDGTHLMTIEHLSGPDDQLHPVQRAMLEHHGSQCGFCTPGIVMSLYGNWLSTPDSTESDIDRAMQGNLCRCTGYTPIIRAALSISDYAKGTEDPLAAERETMTDKLSALRDNARIVVRTGDRSAILPATVDDLADVLEENLDATVVAGATDVGLWVTKSMRDLGTIVFLTRINDMQKIVVEDDRLIIGAGASYTRVRDAIAAHIPQLEELFDRIGGKQVRNAGTIGGNIANGSPIGDTPPPLIALGARITLRKGRSRRVVDLEDFFIEYGRQDLRPGEFLESIAIPLPTDADRFAAYKVSKRFDEDIAAVLGAFRVRLDSGVVREAAIAYGGMAGTPKRARTVEAALIGRQWSRETVEAAMAAYEDDFRPLTDWRASADYRMLVAKNLLLRFWGESVGVGRVRFRERCDA